MIWRGLFTSCSINGHNTRDTLMASWVINIIISSPWPSWCYGISSSKNAPKLSVTPLSSNSAQNYRRNWTDYKIENSHGNTEAFPTAKINRKVNCNEDNIEEDAQNIDDYSKLQWLIRFFVMDTPEERDHEQGIVE